MLIRQNISRTSGGNLIEKLKVVKQFKQNWGPRITAIPVLCAEGAFPLTLVLTRELSMPRRF